MTKPILLYDGDCGICSAFIQWAIRIDHQKQYDFIAFQAFPEDQKAALNLSEAKFARGIYLIFPDSGKKYHGAFAVNRFFIGFFPYNVLVVLLYLFPLLLLAELVIYALVAKYRARISLFLGLNACSLNR